ncbi:Uncharacterised protein [Mycobacteroides abscessus subsp. abscessus]|nr:Uncharacterised protein [Mycobacteroides abscessus subsp. abscessus]
MLSRTIRPPGGSGVVASMPIAFSAAVFTHVEWTSLESRTTGMSATASSIIAAVGSPPGTASNIQLAPRRYSASGCSFRACRSRSWICSRLVQSRSWTLSSAWPNIARCVCASTMPGVTSAPPRSVTSASGPAAATTDSRSPTARTRPASRATASARGECSSPVKTVALVKTVVMVSFRGGAGCGDGGRGQAGSSPRWLSVRSTRVETRAIHTVGMMTTKLTMPMMRPKFAMPTDSITHAPMIGAKLDPTM